MGAVQDAGLNKYVSDVGRRLQAGVQRPEMPYSYRVLNANYINAYTFPGGTMAVTRGIMTELDDESELAALLGHELGHVNARHSAQRQGQALLTQATRNGLRWQASADRSAPARCWPAIHAATSAKPTPWARPIWCRPATRPPA
jgi:predicted Zn-dependent protease